ncbi:hypothetical protein [Polyangium jinanense]|uniref:Uncharacterized protein n=1 Tax=Polyangium jinanense TaxID=2829994 RepID=A0A9X4AX31_9BACT|nr:hypothetical protein [Polyangium jinanense]MDC3962601.1 hypothetical protein [Polyangium jinanense]MDC3985895.1 hypothetical protein [Polyangium jinanense]MDC3988529.1 hypothetical protein [Polyangium jinanense]
MAFVDLVPFPRRMLVAATSGLLLLLGCKDLAPEKPKSAVAGIGAAAAPLRPPPPWLPPNYTEIPWSEAATLIQRQEVDRVFGTRTRRVYVVKREGQKHYTTAPRRGDLAKLLAQIPREELKFLYRDDIEEISWAEAESRIRNKQVISVSTSHFNMVSLSMKGGAYPLAVAPSERDVRKLIEEVDPSGNLLGAVE